jgi:hypothetical protein
MVNHAENIVFIGSSRFGLRALRRLQTLERINIAGVVSANETFRISYNPAGVKKILHGKVAEYS